MIEKLSLLENLIRCYSPTGQEREAAEFLADAMMQLGFEAGLDELGNAVGSKGDGPVEVLMLGHIDTVPGEIAVERRGDDLYGRGAVDAKGPLACFVMAAAAVQPPPGWKLTVVGAVGEEGDSRGARYLLKNHRPPAMVIIGEPSGWDRITLGYKGSLWLRYARRQPMTHSASTVETVCEAAVRFWNAVSLLAERYNQANARVFDQISPTLRSIYSDTDHLFESVEMVIGLRLPPGAGVDQLLNELMELAQGANLIVEDQIPAFRAEKNTPLVRALLASIRQNGGAPGFTLKTGTSDMNLAAAAWECPIVAYGPGDSNLDHTPDEHISIQEYFRGIDVLEGALSRLMQAQSQAIA